MWMLADRFAGLLVEERRKSTGSTSEKLTGKFGRTRRRKPESDKILRDGTAPSTAEAVQTAVDGCLAVRAVDACSAVQTAVDGCCFMMRTAFGGCFLTVKAVTLVVVCLVFCVFRLVQVILWGLVFCVFRLLQFILWGAGYIRWGYLGVRRLGIRNLFSGRLVRAHLD